MNRITSFNVDHDYIVPGVYISRIDGDIITYDLRTRRPNCGDYMDTTTAHTVEHMFATYVRNSKYADNVIYFGPMGCRTGFYLLMRDTDSSEVYSLIIDVLKKIVDHTGEVFGASRKECGNYLDLDIETAKRECREYLRALSENIDVNFEYPTK